ncbi:hypothetical protein BH10PSE15_BH10PSE15_14700 [soil metagenome]
MKIVGWIVVACFALAAAAGVTLVARWFGAPAQIGSFLVAVIGAVATCYGPRFLATLTAQTEAR